MENNIYDLAILGAGPAGICTMLCMALYHPGKLVAIKYNLAGQKICAGRTDRGHI